MFTKVRIFTCLCIVLIRQIYSDTRRTSWYWDTYRYVRMAREEVDKDDPFCTAYNNTTLKPGMTVSNGEHVIYRITQKVADKVGDLWRMRV